MNFKNHVYLLTEDTHTERRVRVTVDADHQFTLAAVCRDFEQLRTQLDDNRAGLVLVDVDPDSLDKIADLSPMVNQYTHNRFVVLADEVSANLVMRAMQAGVRHVQAKAGIATELGAVLHDLAPESPIGRSQGSLLTMLSASGGCGATTLAVNLANEIHLASGQEVLLVDLDYSYGAVANYLELHNAYGIAEVLDHHGVIDYHLIRSTAVRYTANLHALLSPASVNGNHTPLLRVEKLESVLRACRQAYAMTVLDAPRVAVEAAAVMAHASEAIWIVMQPTVKDIRTAKSIHLSLTGRGVPPDRIKTVVNPYQKRRQMIPLDEVEKALSGIPLVLMSNDYASAIRGINYGQPLSDAAPRCQLRRDLRRLALPIAEQLQRKVKGEKAGTDAGHLPS